MSQSTVPVIYQHSDHPEWGRGVILTSDTTRADRFDLSFEMGGKRIILKTFASKLVPVPMPGDEAAQLGERLASRRTANKPIVLKSKKKGAGVPVTIATFEAQVALFESLFPGGFAGEAFVKKERGTAAEKGKKTSREAAIGEAQARLSKEAFAAGDDAKIFDAACELVKTTPFVHPLEGANALATMKPENRARFVAALRDWLHGSGDEAGRFDGFVASIRMEEADGSAKRASWPLATMFAALVHPAAHVCVKPTYFQKQAALVRVPVDYQPAPSGQTYRQFLEAAKATDAALKKAGQAPRDLVDVTSFISVTQGAKPASPKA